MFILVKHCLLRNNIINAFLWTAGICFSWFFHSIKGMLSFTLFWWKGVLGHLLKCGLKFPLASFSWTWFEVHYLFSCAAKVVGYICGQFFWIWISGMACCNNVNCKWFKDDDCCNIYYKVPSPSFKKFKWRNNTKIIF